MLKYIVTQFICFAAAGIAFAQAPAARHTKPELEPRTPVSTAANKHAQAQKPELRISMAKPQHLDLATGHESIRPQLRKEIQAELRKDVSIER